MKRLLKVGFAAAAGLVVAAGWIGCSQQEVGQSVQVGEKVASSVQGHTDKVELRVVLAKADKVDGAEDHVVSKCPGCALAMEGSEDHALEVEGYKLHFCSDSCRDGFSENTAESVMALKVPEAG